MHGVAHVCWPLALVVPLRLGSVRCRCGELLCGSVNPDRVEIVCTRPRGHSGPCDDHGHYPHINPWFLVLSPSWPQK